MLDACHLKKVAINVKLFVLKTAKCKQVSIFTNENGLHERKRYVSSYRQIVSSVTFALLKLPML
jgi:hypothetical protein